MNKILEQLILTAIFLAFAFGASWLMHWVLTDQWLYLLTAGVLGISAWKVYQGYRRAKNLENN